jgi:dolichyl-phosphate-mannose--protein O-mannosyl transferase
MRFYTFILFYSYYFFKKQGRFRPLELSSYFIPFYIAPLVLSTMIVLQKTLKSFSPRDAVFIGIGILLLFFFLQKKYLLSSAFKSNKLKYLFLDNKSLGFLGGVLFGSMFAIAIVCIVLLIYVVKR